MQWLHGPHRNFQLIQIISDTTVIQYVGPFFRSGPWSGQNCPCVFGLVSGPSFLRVSYWSKNPHHGPDRHGADHTGGPNIQNDLNEFFYAFGSLHQIDNSYIIYSNKTGNTKSSMVVFSSDIFRGRPFQQSNRIGFGTGENVYMFKASVVVKARKTIQKIKTNLHTTVQRQFQFFFITSLNSRI